MRPILLEMSGFGVFREPTVVDFDGTEFFALVGPTGSGKSTVIDAICFALYGAVPRYDDQRLVGAALSLGAVEARVRLTFAVGDEQYVAVRIVRRGGGQQQKVSTKEARLERLGDGAVLAGKDGEMRAAMDTLLGLSFEDFTRCVVLPQGEFARFLHDKPADRQALLVRLLDLGVYQRVMNRANLRASEHQRRVDRIDGQLSELPFVDDAMVADLERAVALGDTSQLALAQAEPRLAELDQLLGEARSTAGRLDVLAAALQRIELPPELLADGDALGSARVELARTESGLAAAVGALDAAETAVVGLPDVAALDRLLDAHDRIARGRTITSERLAAEATATATEDEAVRSLGESRGALERAHEAVRQLERAHRAHSVALDLVAGEPCPVCEQPVERLPVTAAPPGLEAARRHVHDAQREVQAGERALAEAQRRAAEARAQAAAGRSRLDELLAEIRAWPDREGLAAERDRVAHVHRRRDEARAAQRAAADAVARARRTLDDVHQRSEALAGEFHRQRDAVVELAPPPPVGSLLDSWTELARWGSEHHPGVVASAHAARADVDSASRRIGELVERLTDSCRAAGVVVGSRPSIALLRDALARRRAELHQRSADIARAAVRRTELDHERHEELERRTVAGELARQLKADRFQRWLVEETFGELARRASVILLRLSSGQFSLGVSGGGEYLVIDHTAADEQRPVRTLSGGETFQASLALALALSDHVMSLADTTGSRRLESIFLDEGFGTLDESSLETVASTIEALLDDGRMVGIVTHVRELADRVPVRFVVNKTPAGATVERVET